MAKKIIFHKKGIITVMFLFSWLANYSQTRNSYAPLSFSYEEKENFIEPYIFPSLMDSALKSNYDCKNCGGHSYGLNIITDITIEREGNLTTLSTGYNIWKVAINAKDAKTLQIHCDKFNLPPGAKLFIYNNDRSVILGPFSNSDANGNIFISPRLNGENLMAEIDYSLNSVFKPEFHIKGIIYRFG